MEKRFVGAAGAFVVVGWLVSLLAQKFIFTELEESHIFLFDSAFAQSALAEPGGLAAYAASFLTQFMIWTWAGPVIAALLYGIVIFTLSDIASRAKAPLWLTAVAALACGCLMLCLENNAFEFQGIVAYALAAACLWAYIRMGEWRWRFVAGVVGASVAYWALGSTALLFAVCAFAYELVFWRKRWWISILYPIIVFVFGWLAVRCGAVPNIKQALTPSMYYLWNSTTYMMNYAWAAMLIFVVNVRIFARAGEAKPKRQLVVFGIMTVAMAAFVWCLYSMVHNPGTYRVNAQRYYAKHGEWQAILDMDYPAGEGTAFTSYRFLAMAQMGVLGEQAREARPFIDYYMSNQELKQKTDNQMLSDVFFACDYLGQARRRAFDTNIVTPGAFNPEETKKLALINIAYGDYAVADKLLSQLEKTLFYAGWARDQRRFLYDDAAVEADPRLGAMRRAIPPENNYMSPKGTARDLKYIFTANPDQQVARQFYDLFSSLTNIYE